MEKKYEIGGKTFVLNEEKAVQAFQEKMVINGRDTMTFNLLPLKYQWAYDLYRKMKSNHWEPEDIPMQKDLGAVEKSRGAYPMVNGGLS